MTALYDMISQHPKEKTLIFCNYMDEMDLIQGHLESLGHLVFRIDGSVDQALRTEMIDTFKRAPTGVFVIQIKSGGQGLNLQEATRVYITSPSWNPATELQVCLFRRPLAMSANALDDSRP